MSRLRGQDGFTLPELLTAMTLFLFILGATLGTFDGFVTRTSANTKLNDSADQARTSMERLARQLRNLASPTNASLKSIELATPDDLVFQTVDAAKRRVRYCLNSSNPAKSTLWVQTQAFPLGGGALPGLPATSSCPALATPGGWADPRVAAADVVNRYNGAARNVFYYPGLGADGDTAKITLIRAELFLDTNPAKSPAEISIATGAFLRNQNQTPVIPDISVVLAGPRRFILNGSEAYDLEGRTLDYFWYKGSGSNPASLPTCASAATQTGGGYTCIGRGLSIEHILTSTDPSPPTITLKVVDPGGLSATFTKVGL
ncbi:MAG: prepilin-type N-terminal cleavage/methylation domain-containing protein [Actinomycetota bacterium]|nr:prepilin-type N-terminal cleavage/methylation domain-containing protein [Actinomycetota bacterium]